MIKIWFVFCLVSAKAKPKPAVSLFGAEEEKDLFDQHPAKMENSTRAFEKRVSFLFGIKKNNFPNYGLSIFILHNMCGPVNWGKQINFVSRQ